MGYKFARLRSRSAVEGKKVDSAAGKTSELTLLRELDDAIAESRGADTLVGQEVGTETGNVGSGHRGAGDGVGAAVVPGAEDGNAGSEDIDKSAVVGEGGLSVRGV